MTPYTILQKIIDLRVMQEPQFALATCKMLPISCKVKEFISQKIVWQFMMSASFSFIKMTYSFFVSFHKYNMDFSI